MHRYTQVAATFAIATAVSVGAFSAFVPTQVNERPSLLELLDPTLATRNLCGHQGAERGLFFRPDFLMALAPKAHAAEVVEEGPPLWDGLKGAHHKISPENEEVQAYFDQGIALTFAFNHWEAARSFKKAQELDPTCAICYWAEAFVLGPNINAPMDKSAIEPAFAAASKAVALKANASPAEQALIDAMAKRYSPDPEADRAELDKAYANAMEDVYSKYPDDLDVATFYAESLMDLSPWDYWERDFVTPKPHIGQAIDAVEKVLAANPDHPGSIHLYIHLMEPSHMPEKAEPYADRLAALLPAAGHLVHMPGHTYFRIGRYIDSLKTNIEAVKRDEEYLSKVKGSDVYRYGYYPHNVHFVLVSAQMAGDGTTTVEFAHKLDELIPMESLSTAPWMQPIKVAPYFALVQYGEAEDVLGIAEPPAEYPYLKAMWHYSRGVVLAGQGKSAEAAAEADALHALIDTEEIAALVEGDVPAVDVLTMAETIVRARVDQADQNYDAAIEKLRTAVVIEAEIPYTEPPYWYYPVEQTLGAVLLQAGRHDEAIDAFRDSLIKHPNNAWSLYGMMKAQEGAQDPLATMTKGLFLKAAVSAEDVPLEKL